MFLLKVVMLLPSILFRKCKSLKKRRQKSSKDSSKQKKRDKEKSKKKLGGV